MHLKGDININSQNIFSSFCYIKYTQVIGKCLISKSMFLSEHWKSNNQLLSLWNSYFEQMYTDLEGLFTGLFSSLFFLSQMIFFSWKYCNLRSLIYVPQALTPIYDRWENISVTDPR